MIIDCHRHDLFRMLLTNHILVQCRLDLVGCRDGMDIQYRIYLLLLFRLFLFDTLHSRHHSREIGKIDHTDIRHAAGALSLLCFLFFCRLFFCSHIHIRETAKSKPHISQRKARIVHRIKGSLHTVLADADIIWNPQQRSCDTLRASTDITSSLRLFVMVIRRILCGFCSFRAGF